MEFGTFDIETITVPFGKFRGTPLSEMDPGYLEWMLRKASERDAWDGIVNFVGQYEAEIREAIRAISVREAEAFEVDYELNDGQTTAAEGVFQALVTDDACMARIDGGAGYGKSFTVMEVVRRLKLEGFKVQACATSYVATQVLDKQLSRIGVHARTIASTIRLEKVEVEDREEYTMTDKTGEALRKLLSPGRVLIVDEDSMVSDDIGRAMIDATRHGGKLITIGDVKQLPPVKQAKPSVLTTIEPCFTLTQPMRYAETSDLYALEQIARFNPEGVMNGGWVDSDEITVHETLTDLLDAFVRDYRADPKGDARVLFFRRKDVFNTNDTIRAMLHGSDAIEQPIIEDERLMVLSTSDIAVARSEEPVRFYSGETFLVERVEQTTVAGIPCYMVKFDNGLTVPVIINVPDSRGSNEYHEKLNQLRDEARDTGYWGDWREFKNTFLQVGYNYAMTVHRAQGQTVDRVYFAPSMLQGSMRDALTYVAGTRAKKHVHMLRSWRG